MYLSLKAFGHFYDWIYGSFLYDVTFTILLHLITLPRLPLSFDFLLYDSFVLIYDPPFIHFNFSIFLILLCDLCDLYYLDLPQHLLPHVYAGTLCMQ